MSESRRELYLELLKWGETLIGDEAGLRMIRIPPVGNSGRSPDFMGYAEWVLYEITKNEKHAAAAHQMITGERTKWMAGKSYHRDCALMDEFCHYPFAFVLHGLSDKSMLSPDEEKVAKDFLAGSLRFWQEYPTHFCGSAELDVGNLGITPACGADYASRHIFKGKFAKSLRSYADGVWNGYWGVGDCPEDSSNYEVLHFTYMPLWGKIRGQMKPVQSYVANGAYERCLQQILPIGAPVDQGDGYWMSGWDGWIASFEIAAKVTGDGRYACMAKRVLDALLSGGFRKSVEESVSLAKAGDARHMGTLTGLPQSLFFLALAVQWADDSIEAVEPAGQSSSITYRTYSSLPNAFEQCQLGGGSAAMTMFKQGRGERREDKLVMRSGYGGKDNCLVASIDKKAYHDHDDSGAILAWADKGHLLLHCPGYHQRNLNAHNVLYVRPRTTDVEAELGATYCNRGVDHGRNRCELDFIEDFSSASFARYKSTHLGGYDATWRRTIIFPKDGAFLAVMDEIGNRGGELWGAPLWHVQNVLEEGPGWADTDQGALWAFPNTTWSVQTRRLLVCAPLTGKLKRIRQDNPDLESPRPSFTREDRLRYWGQQECLYQHGDVATGGRNWFLTILVPHDPDVPAKDVAKRVRVLANLKSEALPAGSPPAWCVEISDGHGGRRLVGMTPSRLPAFYNVPKPDHHGYMPSWAEKDGKVGDPHADRSHWMNVEDGGRPVISTDAEIFMVTQADGRTEVAARRMRNIEVGGLKHHSGITPTWAPTRCQVNCELESDKNGGRARYACRNYCPADLSFGFTPSKVKVSGGRNGISSIAKKDGELIKVEINGTAEVKAVVGNR